MIQPGITTLELDREAELYIRSRGAVPAFKGYRGFPGTLCTSVNDEVVHGIPGPRMLKDGDILSIDVGALYEGFYSDSARTFPVGEVSPLAKKLMEVTRRALDAGISQAVAGNRISDISASVQKVVEDAGFSVVRDFVGHGVGRDLHEAPQVANFGKRGKGPVIQEGMTLAIEPMVNVGEWEVRILGNGWTVVTADGSLSAHFEDSIAVTKNGPLVLSAP
jgi:methionyl aminopeptidase